ncbi:unnamed protein product [Discosporangium mesarthrocarpum]
MAQQRQEASRRGVRGGVRIDGQRPRYRRSTFGNSSYPAKGATGGGGEPMLLCTLQHVPPTFVYDAIFQPLAIDASRTAHVPGKPHSWSGEECSLVVTGAYDHHLRLWDIGEISAGGQGTELGTLSGKVVHESHVNAIVYDAKNGRLYSGDGGGLIVVWRRTAKGRQPNAYSVLRKVRHPDIDGKSITSLALAPRLRRGQLLVQAHGNTLRLFDLSTYQLINPGYAGGAATGSLVRASFSPDGRYVVSGSEEGRLRVWDSQGGKRVQGALQVLGMACALRDVAWHPSQHVIAMAGYGQDAPVLLYCGDGRQDRKQGGGVTPYVQEGKAAREAQETSEGEHMRRLHNRQRLRTLRMKRLRDKQGAIALSGGRSKTSRGGGAAAIALAALTAANAQEQHNPA